MKTIYLDNNATTAVAPEVREAMLPYLTDLYGNPSSMHTFGGQVGRAVEEARERMAALLGAHPDEIIFTSCGSESDNAAIWSALQTQPEKRHLITTRVEHPAILNVAQSGDHVVSMASIYGGTFNLFAVTLKKMGIEVTFVDQRADDAEIEKAIRPNTKAVFGETLTNPSMDVLDIERIAALAHRHGLPLIVDNTFATPVLCRPFDFGADIVVHSTTKYMDGHALQMGGVIVDSGKFDWTSGRFPEFTEPDASYHGLIYTKAFGKAAYIVKARVQLMRDLGCCQTPQGAFYINQGLETLPLRMERHCRNAEAVATFLAGHDKVESVCYPWLPDSHDKALAEKYLPKGCSGVISFSLKGGRDAGARFIDSLKMVSLQVHVADIRTCVLHPASSTHRQLSDEQLTEAGITPGMVRLSVGLENIDDLLEDLSQALAQA